MVPNQNNLPTMRLRRSSYNLLSKLRKAPGGIEGDTREIREAGKCQSNKTFQWVRNERGVWWLNILE